MTKKYFFRLKPYANKLQELENRLDSGIPANYPFDRYVTKRWNVEKGLLSKRIENINSANFLPHTLICGLIDTDVINGDSAKVSALC